MSETCETCKFSLAFGEDTPDQMVLCRRFPPALHPQCDGEAWEDFKWPVVDLIDWCGEYKPKEST